jgi:hypothetical protein
MVAATAAAKVTRFPIISEPSCEDSPRPRESFLTEMQLHRVVIGAPLASIPAAAAAARHNPLEFARLRCYIMRP